MILLLIIMSWANLSTELLQERYYFAQIARNNLLAFAQFTSPEPSDFLNPRKSRFTVKPHQQHLAFYLDQIRRGEINRLEIELPARHGKSELAVRKFVPWVSGNNPEKSGIVVTHTDQLAREHGRDCRDIFRMGAYKLVFGKPACALREDTQANDLLKLQGGGVLTFSGRGGLGAGVGADWMIFDDFFKNSEEAQSQLVRDNAWHTFISDCQSRLNTDSAPVVLIGTRRHEDDVQGRLFDPNNEHYDEREARRWVRIRLPALAEANDPLGREVDEALWPEKYGAPYYLGRRNHKSDIVRMDHQTQDQCNPTPAEGDYFKKKWIVPYELTELPKKLRIYVSSDHAYRKGQKNDKQCLLVVGVDAADVIWILPDTWWERAATDTLVEAMIGIMENRQPSVWWAARDAISGSIGPFLHKRMRERNVFAWVNDEIREDKDLERRAQSIRNRMAMGMVRFPAFAPWFGEAEKELTTFPNAGHDDFVAALAMLGMGMNTIQGAAHDYQSNTMPKPGTMAWARGENKRNEAERKVAEATKGW